MHRDGLALSTLAALVSLPSVPAAAQCLESCRLLAEFTGEAGSDQFGWVSAPIPDIDGDGATEIAVAAPFHDADGVSNAGRVYLYSGRTGLLLWTADGPTAGTQLGYSLRRAGDIDGDAVPDVIAGGPGTDAGRAIVLSGADGSIIHDIPGTTLGERFGSAVMGTDDVDGDLVPDLAIGADGSDVAGTNAGRVYILSGADGATILDVYEGPEERSTFGNSVGALEDVSGDGIGDLVVGAPNAGADSEDRAYILSLGEGSIRTELVPDESARSFGQFFVADVGDLSGDGIGDVYVGDFSDAGNGNGAGRAYVFDGTTGERVLVLAGSAAGEGFGIGRGAGDVNGDGVADLLLAGWTFGGGAPNAGRAQVFSGVDGSVIRTFTSITGGEAFGFDAHGVGDVDADGRPDFFVTAAYNSEVATRAGKCYLISGGLTLQAPDPGDAGEVNTVVVNGSVPGHEVALAAGFSVGTTPVPNCPGLVLDIGDPRLVATAIADGLGNATFEGLIPPGVGGRILRLQAGEPETCMVSNDVVLVP